MDKGQPVDLVGQADFLQYFPANGLLGVLVQMNAAADGVVKVARVVGRHQNGVFLQNDGPYPITEPVFLMGKAAVLRLIDIHGFPPEMTIF